MIAIEWSGQAGRDRDKAFEAALQLGAEDAEVLLDMLEHAEQFLVRTPFAGTPVLNGERRKWRLGYLPYALIYLIDGDLLQVLRLIHLRSDWQTTP